tara:strand:- start:2739 stop:3512 length:774 start_codon:yes stop_codon:yes gene_type:complete
MTEETVENTEATVAETPMAFDPRSLPEDLSNEPSLRNFDDVGKLAKSYVNLVKKMGVPSEQLVKLPTNGDYTEVYNQLGRPSDPAGYEIDISNDLNKDYAENAHKLGLSKDQAREIYNWISTKHQQQESQQKDLYQEQVRQGVDSLRKEWGNNFDAETQIAKQAFLQLADAEMVQTMEESGLGNSPQMIKLFNRVGQILKEDGMLQNDVAFGDSGGRASIQDKLDKIMDSESPYWDGMHPDHDKFVTEALKLREMLL